jgi:hypothetical protein
MARKLLLPREVAMMRGATGAVGTVCRGSPIDQVKRRGTPDDLVTRFLDQGSHSALSSFEEWAMPKSHKKNLTRSLAAGLAVCAVAPGTALAVPATNGPSAAANSGSGVTAQDYRSLDYRAPTQTGSRGDGAAKQALRSDQTDGRATGASAAPGPPQWPVNPQPIAKAHPAARATPANDGGVDTGIWIGLAAAALALAAGIGFAGGQRSRSGRQGQPA